MEGQGAHPRSRGENTWASMGFGRAAGSSPLTRGKRRERPLSRSTPGLIPAHAGKTSRSSPSSQASRAHPRSRGENAASTAARKVSLGSSPLTRGKPRIGHDGRNLEGLIPAHAGKTAKQAFEVEADGAHPRSRGENDRALSGKWQVKGSSPLTRGKLQHRRVGHNGGGLIPAHAGKTESRHR